jgi:hypothetical protein
VAAKEEIVILAKETGLKDFSEDAILEVLASRSVTLVNEEPARLDRRTYKGTHEFRGDNESVTSGEHTFTIILQP